MQKEQLLDFINRYHLGGKIDSTSWIIENGSVTTKFRSLDKSFMGSVTKQKFGFDEDCEIGILQTGQLLKLISILSDEFDFDLNKYETATDEEKITAIKLVNGKTRVNYMLSDLTVIPKSKGLKGQPEYNVTIDINTDFIEQFIKGVGALPDVKSFTLIYNSKLKTHEIVIGYASSINAHSVYIPVEVTQHLELDRAISFSAEYFKEILSANKGAEHFKFSVSTQGIAHVEVKDGDFVNDYYLSETPTDV